jgi:hypothetical protein
MSKTTIAFYRLPIATSTQIGRLRVVVDRNRQVYLADSKVVTAQASGDFMILTLANQQVYYVKARDYNALPAPKSAR